VNRHLFTQFGTIVQEQVSVSIRLRDIWFLLLESEIAFSHIVEFCELGGFRFAASNSENVIDLSFHKYLHFIENRWDCYHKFWKLTVTGEQWCKLAEQLFVLEPEA